jgi:hypothetical protein
MERNMGLEALQGVSPFFLFFPFYRIFCYKGQKIITRVHLSISNNIAKQIFQKFSIKNVLIL